MLPKYIPKYKPYDYESYGCEPCESKPHVYKHEYRSEYMSKECDPCDCTPALCKAKDCHFCPKPIVMECTCGTGTTLPPGTGGPGTFFNPIPLGCLTFDTTCLCKPMIKFDFCAIISTTIGIVDLGVVDPIVPAQIDANGINGTVDLKFRLCKTCNGGEKVCCGTWDFRTILNPGDQLTTSFNFCHCESNTCPGCCIYTVELFQATTSELLVAPAPAAPAPAPVAASATVSIWNTTLSAIAVSSC